MMKKFISIFLSLALIRSVAIPLYEKQLHSIESLANIQIVDKNESLGNIQTIDNTGDLSKVQTIDKAKGLSKVQTIDNSKDRDNTNRKLSKKSGQVFLSGKLSAKEVPGEKSATRFLEENKLLFGIDSVAEELKVIEAKEDDIGHTFVKFVQVIKGIKVKGSIINVHFDKDGVIVSVNGKFEANKNITTTGDKTISESEAIEIAKNQYSFKSLRNTPKVEKLILIKENQNYEVFKVNISYAEPTIGNYDVFVEAHSGEVIQTENNIRHGVSTTGSGIDVLGQNRTLNLYLDGNSYQMRDLTKSATSSIVTNSLNNGTSIGTLVSNSTNFFGTEKHKASVSAHYNAGKVIDFYKNLFNRNSLDGKGMAIKSFTHYGHKYNNAFWSGYEMVYGDGDGYMFTYLSGDLDIVGHEMTHGIISNTANLQYRNESGALNESIADVFGVLISTYDKYNVASGGSWRFSAADWVIGDDVYTPYIAGDALRSLSKPTLYGQPDNMINYKYYPDTEAGDFGGVHVNSGIPNKAAYLIANSIGMEKTARIYYRALVNYMTPYTDFGQAKSCLMQAATDLYGENEAIAINNAFNSVGIVQAAVVHNSLSIPTNFKATRISSENVSLTWNAVTSAEGYEVYSLLTRKTYLYYTNSGLIPVKTYHYKIRSFRTVGTIKVYSNWSKIVNVRP